MELLVIPKEKEDIERIDTGMIVGLQEFSTNYNVKLTLEEIEKMSKKKDLFVAINKVIFNHDLEELEKALTILTNTDVKGVLFYDLSVLSIKKRKNLNINLIWNQTHMVTNYNTCNYYYNNGVEGCLLANEITLDEMLEIKDKTNLKVMANVVFKPVMSHSRRSLLTNYFKSIGKEKEDRDYTISEKKKEKSYIVKEDETGTTIVYGNIVNGILPLFQMVNHNFNYGIIDKTYLTDREFDFSLDLVTKIINGQLDEKTACKEAEKVLGTDTGFFYKKTIYKVK